MSQLTAKVTVEYVAVLYTEFGNKVDELFCDENHDYVVEEAKERLQAQIRDSGYQYFYVVIEERIVPIYE